MSLDTFSDRKRALTFLIGEYDQYLLDYTLARDRLRRCALEATLIPGVRKQAFIALCKSLAEIDGDIEERITAANDQIDLMLAPGLEHETPLV